MITHINTGQFLYVTNPSPTYYNTGLPSAGLLRYHNNQMQVYEGASWMPVGGTATVDLTHDAQELLLWARRKKKEDEDLEVRLWKHPGLQEAYHQFRVMDALTKQEDNNNEVA